MDSEHAKCPQPYRHQRDESKMGYSHATHPEIAKKQLSKKQRKKSGLLTIEYFFPKRKWATLKCYTKATSGWDDASVLSTAQIQKSI